MYLQSFKFEINGRKDIKSQIKLFSSHSKYQLTNQDHETLFLAISTTLGSFIVLLYKVTSQFSLLLPSVSLHQLCLFRASFNKNPRSDSISLNFIHISKLKRKNDHKKKFISLVKDYFEYILLA
ncbi:hypothetical protein QL285_083534 [Trifolium repens]|nr:hypothetical protein QL285_083534 [Trifolium repens]